MIRQKTFLTLKGPIFKPFAYGDAFYIKNINTTYQKLTLKLKISSILELEK